METKKRSCSTIFVRGGRTWSSNVRCLMQTKACMRESFVWGTLTAKTHRIFGCRGRICHLFDILIRITCRCLFSSFKLICQRSKMWSKNFHSVALPAFLWFEPAVDRVHSETGKDNDSLGVCTCSRCRCLICSLNYKNSHCIEAGPRQGLFLLCNFYFTNNFAPPSQTDAKFYNDHSWSFQGAVRSNSKLKDFIQLILFCSKCFMDCIRVEDLQVLKVCCNWKHCDLLANESPHPAETESGCHPSRAKPLWGGKLTSERLAAIFRVHRSIHTISNYCFRKFWLTLNPSPKNVWTFL